MSHELFGVHLLAIVAYAVLAHGVLLLNDGLYWDGWIVDSWQRNRSWPLMKRFFSEVGLVQLYYQHRWLGGLPHRLLCYRLVAFASLLLSAIAVYCLARQLGRLDEDHCLAIALLYLSYTGYHMNVDTVVGVNYTLPTALFYWAAYLAVLGIDQAGAAHWGLRLASLLMFALAFNANSTLVYYFGFLGLWYGLGIVPGADYVVLPFLYWFLKNRLTPRHGHYADYNRIRPWSPYMPRALLDTLRFGLEAALTAPIVSAARRHYLWLIAVAALAGLGVAALVSAPLLAPPRTAIALLAAGAVLLFLAALPYALVAQTFYPNGWGTKNHMLFHLPVALLVFGALSLTESEPAALAALSVILTANAVHINLTYLYYLAAWVKNRSWLRKLSQWQDADKQSVFLIEDRHSIRADPSLPEIEHRPAYLFYMFEWLWGDKRRFGIPVVVGTGARLSVDQVTQQMTDSTLAHDMQAVDTQGAQARVLIADGARRNPTKIALLYLSKRYLRGGELEPLLDSVTDVHFTSLPRP